MDMDALKSAWEAQSRALDASMRLNVQLLARNNLNRVEHLVSRMKRERALSLFLDFIALLLLGSFAAGVMPDWRYMLPAGVLGVFVIGRVIDSVAQFVQLSGMDYDEPVVALQKRLLAVRARRLRRFMWTISISSLLWVALAIVAGRALIGIDVYRLFGAEYVIANAAFGIAALGGLLLLARYAGARFERYAFVKRFLDDVAGHSLTRALEDLDSLARFESEPPAA